MHWYKKYCSALSNATNYTVKVYSEVSKMSLITTVKNKQQLDECIVQMACNKQTKTVKPTHFSACCIGSSKHYLWL